MPKLLIVDPAKLGPSMQERMIAAMPVAAFRTKDGTTGVYFSGQALEVLGMKHESARITAEVEAVAAHEIGHIKMGHLKPFGLARIAKFSPLAGLIGGIGIMMALRHHWKHQHPQHHAENVILQDGEEPPKHVVPHHSPLLSGALAVGQYLLAATAGTIAGAYVFKKLHHHMEFACDAFSKELMGSGQPLASALTKLFDHMKKIESELLKDLSPDRAAKIKKIARFVESFFHPAQEARVAVLTR